MATLKKDWKMPTPPKCECGYDIKPIAHNTGDGIYLGWNDWCEECNSNSTIYCNEDDFVGLWPFEEEYAFMRDFESIGFMIV